MPSRFLKDPDAVLDYSVDWEDWLDGDTISVSSWVVESGLTKDSDGNTDTVATVWLSGGSDGTKYIVTNSITTAAGREDARELEIVVREMW